jgi:hypothetical protein
MKSKVLWALVAINAFLLVALFLPRVSPTAQAAGVPRPGEYILLPGQVTGGGGNEVIYILDETNRMLTARVYDQNVKGGGGFSDMPPIMLDRVFQTPPR